MSLIKRESVQKPSRRSEQVLVPALGGDVLVCRLGLAELSDVRGDSQGIAFMVRLLAAAVRDADGRALFDADEWSLWGRDNEAAFKLLSDAVLRLNGGDAEHAKNG